MSQGCSLLEQVSKNCHIYLCYVAMINSQSLRGHWGLQCCGVANFVCVCGISVNKSHRALLRWSQTLKCAVFVFSNLHYPVWSEIYCGFWLTFRWEKKLALSFITAIACLAYMTYVVFPFFNKPFRLCKSWNYCGVGVSSTFLRWYGVC